MHRPENRSHSLGVQPVRQHSPGRETTYNGRRSRSTETLRHRGLTICGIVGITGRDPSELRDKLDRMTAAVAHRGPDGRRYWIGPMRSQPDRLVGLGHTRLKIIDLSEAASQPLPNEDKSVWVTFNGEIFNYIQLRRQLEMRGHIFRSESDTEVIVHLYEDLGLDFLREINGMFALAIWDARACRLTLARDRLGEKPLYYTANGESFAFSSEIKALLAADLIHRHVNWQAAADYFTYLFVPHPETIFEDVFQLPPAHYAQYDPISGRLSVAQYWDALESLRAVRSERDENAQAWQADLRAVLEDAVRIRLRSDVPLGVFLSGGVDSTILAGLAASATPGRIRTFTVTFAGGDGQFYDERRQARQVSACLGSDHHEIDIDLSHPGDILDLAGMFDQPFGNPTFHLTYLISQRTKQHASVALSGVGGDEFFAGYPRYQAVRYLSHIGLVPQPFLRAVSAALRATRDDYRTPRLQRIRQLIDGADPDFLKQYQQWTYYGSRRSRDALFASEPLRKACAPQRVLAIHFQRALDREADRSSAVQYVDQQTFLVDNLLEYSDKASMASALEVRAPFLDHRVAELSMRMPYRLKLAGRRSKAILRDTFADLLNATQVGNSKRGFCPPLSEWIRGPLGSYFDEWMRPEQVLDLGIFHWAEIDRLRREHASGHRDNSMELFGLIMFDRWYREYVLGRAASQISSRELQPLIEVS